VARHNIMKQAASLHKIQLSVAGDGALVETSATDFRPFQQVQLGRFNGNNFDTFGDVLTID
jgi:branched-chain amino acid transport system substrate-binding protein